MVIFEQDTDFDVDKIKEGYYKSEESIWEGQKYLQPMYTELLNLVYERYEQPEFGESRKKEARFICDTVFMECLKWSEEGKAEKED